jgi:hypothetical protein
MNKSRRQFLLQSLAAAAVATTGRLFWVKSEEFVPDALLEDDSWLFLEPDDRLVLAVITPVILDGVIDTNLSDQNLLNYLKDFDYSLSLLPMTQQEEFRELLMLLTSLIGRVVVAGVWSSWNQVSASEIDQMLNSWRNSFIDLMKVAYTGLKELSYATWYGNPDNWSGIGYPGPPELYK